ncbi:YybH family protein [Pseudonocardia hispaniensis]|uniref:YybH family protein n=1 Tax=Pseudonocardia hispaniensis TaxID=904933 RepID=A0ABW1J2M8_9PSEU
MSTTPQIAAYRQFIDSADPDADVAAVLHIHREWWNANCGVDIPRMRPNFPDGQNYVMFNLQGHPYYGIDEKVRLWEHYREELNIPELPETRIVQFVLQGDLAWLAAEVIFTLGEVGERGLGASSAGYRPSLSRHRIRSTECYRRDDGNGNPDWRMWHFHCSPLPDADEPRPPFGDSARQRNELVP